MSVAWCSKKARIFVVVVVVVVVVEANAPQKPASSVYL